MAFAGSDSPLGRKIQSCDLFACNVPLKRRQRCPQPLVSAVLAQYVMGRMSCVGVPARVHEHVASKGGCLR